MKKQILWTTFIAVSFSPVTDAYSATVDILCTTTNQGGNVYVRQECTSSSLSQTSSYDDGDTVTCECPTDSSMKIDYRCSSNYQYNNSGDDRDIIDEADWLTDGCYEVSSGGGNTGGETPSSSESSGQCAAGEFDIAQTCYSCAEETGNPNATSDRGATSIEDCYITAMTEMSDASGTFVYESNCYFSCGTNPDNSLCS